MLQACADSFVTAPVFNSQPLANLSDIPSAFQPAVARTRGARRVRFSRREQRRSIRQPQNLDQRSQSSGERTEATSFECPSTAVPAASIPLALPTKLSEAQPWSSASASHKQAFHSSQDFLGRRWRYIQVVEALWKDISRPHQRRIQHAQQRFQQTYACSRHRTINASAPLHLPWC